MRGLRISRSDASEKVKSLDIIIMLLYGRTSSHVKKQTETLDGVGQQLTDIAFDHCTRTVSEDLMEIQCGEKMMLPFVRSG